MLHGLKVIELATYVAAPGAGAILSDWGADVIKIESAEGDPMRQFFASLGKEEAVNPVFEVDNRGKRSIVLDIASADGQAIVARLLQDADVLLTNIRPASLKRAGLDFGTVHARFPRLIYASVTGYGLTGDDADRPGFDTAAFWARSGLMAASTVKGGEPGQPRTAVGDHVCSLATAAAILAAVVDRHTTGVGRLVETSLLRAGTYVLGSDLGIQLHMGRLASTRARHEAVNPMNNFFRTADGRWFAIIPRQGSGDWPRLARAAGIEALIEDDRFAGAKARRTNVAELVTLLDEAFAAMDFETASAALDRENLVWAPVQTPAEVARDAQAEAAGCFTPVPLPDGSMLRSVASPARFDGQDVAIRCSAPAPGEHTESVLEQLGFTADERAAFRISGAIA